MARAKQELPAEVPDVALQEPVQEDYSLNDTILLEKIHDLRFVDDDGNLYRLEQPYFGVSGEYRLVRA